MQASSKQLFEIFRVETWDTLTWDGKLERKETLIGETWAVSKAQALAQFKWRSGVKDEVMDLPGDANWSVYYIARPKYPYTPEWHYREGWPLK